MKYVYSFCGSLLLIVIVSALFAEVGASATAEVGAFAQSQACPKVSVTSSDSVKEGEALKFTAIVAGGPNNISPTYNWSVSAGAISSGQGTSVITVDTKGLGSNTVTATVDLGGFDRSCSAYASSTTAIEVKIEPRKIEEYGILTAVKEHMPLDNLAKELQLEPLARGYIIAYGGRSGSAGEAQKTAARAKTYLTKTDLIDDSRLIIAQRCIYS